MNYNYIVNPLTNRKCSIHSRNGQNIINKYINQDGGACSICGAEGVNKSTCPRNPVARNPKPEKHNVDRQTTPKTPTPKAPSPKTPKSKAPSPKTPKSKAATPKQDLMKLYNVLGPYYASYFQNMKLEGEPGPGRNILLLGEHHDKAADCKIDDPNCFANWIENVAINSPHCIDFFLEGTTWTVTPDPKLPKWNWKMKPYIKEDFPKIYAHLTGGNMIDEVRLKFFRLFYDKLQFHEKFPNFRYHFVDIRQIHDHFERGLGKTIERNILSLQDNISKILSEVNELLEKLKDRVDADISVVDGDDNIRKLRLKTALTKLSINMYFFGGLYKFNVIDYILDETDFISLSEIALKFNKLFESEYGYEFLRLMYELIDTYKIKNPNLFINEITNIIQDIDSKLAEIAQFIPYINDTTRFLKKVIDKQFNKSLLTKKHFIKNKDIWIKKNTEQSLPDFYSQVMIMDIYTLCRMFAKFSEHKMGRGPLACKSKLFMSPRNIIFYGGALHTQNYEVFLNRIDPGSLKFIEDGTLTERFDSVDLKGFNFFENAI